MSKIVDIASILTTLTQNLFCVDESNGWEFINKKEFLLLCSKTKFSGVMIPDDGMINRIEFFSDDGAKIFIGDQQKTKEIIEERDCIIDDYVCLPERVDTIFKIIENDYKLQQSCKRFHEALMLRNHAKQRTPSTIHYTAYELVAYVASIEALLDTKAEKMEVNCPNCDEIVYKEEWKIAVKFRDFIDKYGDNNPVFNKVYKDLYSDRSMFVHTGINLHSLNSLRPNRPLILKGKNVVSEQPYYYHNIHEYTGFILRKYIYSKLFCELPKV